LAWSAWRTSRGKVIWYLAVIFVTTDMVCSLQFMYRQTKGIMAEKYCSVKRGRRYPAELEHEAVTAAAVVPSPHPIRLSMPKADILLAPVLAHHFNAIRCTTYEEL